MSDELKTRIQLTHTANGRVTSIDTNNLVATTGAGRVIEGVQNIGTSAELIEIGDIPSDSVFTGYFRNLDATNFLVLSQSVDGTSPFAKLRPGASALIPLSVTAVYAMADTAACNLEFCLIEDATA